MASYANGNSEAQVMGTQSVDLEYNPVSCSNSPIPHHSVIRFLSVLCFIVSTVQIIRGVPLFQFMDNIHLGAWWGVLNLILAGSCSLFASRGFILAGCILAGIGVGTALLGALEDDIGHRIFDQLTACAAPSLAGDKDPAGLVLTGSPDSFFGAKECFVNNLQQYPINTNNCYCTQVLVNGDSSFCGYYELSALALQGGRGCADLNGWYSDGLLSSADTLMVAACVGLALAVLNCVSLCSGVLGSRVPAFPKAPSQQQYVPPQPQYPQHGGGYNYGVAQPQDPHGDVHQPLLPSVAGAEP